MIQWKLEIVSLCSSLIPGCVCNEAGRIIFGRQINKSTMYIALHVYVYIRRDINK